MLARRKVKNDAKNDEVDEAGGAGETIDSKRVTRAMARGLRIDDESDDDEDDDDYTDIDDDDEMDDGSGDEYFEVGKDEDHK